MIEMHKLTKLFKTLVFFYVLLCAHVDAAEVNKIVVQGNRRIPSSSIIAFSELTSGVDVKKSDITSAIKAIHSRGIFSQVRIEIKGKTLVITVKERAVIRKVDVKKNKLIPEEGLNEILKKNNLVAGEVLEPTKLRQFEFMVLNEYRLNGYPEIDISSKITSVNEGMVDIKITIMKGPQYQVRRVNIDGNLAFSDRQVQSKMLLGTPSLYARLFGGNYFSKQAFEKSKASLTNFYIEQGFLKFSIDDTKVEKVPNSKFVDIEVKVSEGPRFMYGHVGVYGDKAVSSVVVGEVQSLQEGIRRGEKLPFKRKDIYQLRKKVAQAIEKKGYTIKSIEPKVEVNEKDATVDIRFFVERGIPVVVRRVDFNGNSLTMDRVLRRELALSEGEVLSETAILESKRRLSNLGYIKNVQHKVSPVANNPREVDVIFSLEEDPQATANFEMGMNQTDFVVFSAGMVHPNFGGAGNNVDLKVEKSRVRTTISLKGDVPFVLRNGLGVGYKLYYNKQEGNKDNTSTSRYTWQQSYSAEKLGLNLSVKAPISLYQDIALSAEVNKNNYDYDPSNADIPYSVTESINRYGNNLWNFVMTSKWIRSTLDRAVLPTSGNKEEVSFKLGAPLNESFTSYVTIDSKVSVFKKMRTLPVTFNPTARLGFGKGFRGFTNITGCTFGGTYDESCDTELPFDEKFYSTPVNPVRGVMTFGEKVNGKAIGGDLITTASMNIFLKPFNDDQVIPSLFLDGGYAYNDHAFNFSQWVYSAGLQFRVMTPIAPVVLVFSYPLKIDGEDSDFGKDTFRYFQFSMQASLY